MAWRMSNQDDKVVADFGLEWSTYNQACLRDDELSEHFERYFRIFPWEQLPPAAQGFDVGCGSGRWAKKVAPRVGKLHCLDASAAALAVARSNLAGLDNCAFYEASVGKLPLADESMDFGYALGVLHHVPDPATALRGCVEKLHMGAPFLLYLYYAMDNQPWWYRGLWQASDAARRRLSQWPSWAKLPATVAIAAAVYWPCARAARVAESLGYGSSRLPLYAYRNASFYTMKTDALDRFGTTLEHRFTRSEMTTLMTQAGLTGLYFSNEIPYWCAVGYRAW